MASSIAQLKKRHPLYNACSHKANGFLSVSELRIRTLKKHYSHGACCLLCMILGYDLQNTWFSQQAPLDIKTESQNLTSGWDIRLIHQVVLVA